MLYYTKEKPLHCFSSQGHDIGMEVPMRPNHITDPAFQQRFWANMRRTSTGCQEWQGLKHRQGYGEISFSCKKKLTHRVAWILTYGAIPEGLSVLHRCDNPPCCNPDHLFLGTYRDNVHDCQSKGRGANTKGEHNGRAKLTADQVLEIRALYETGSTSFSQTLLAKRFNVTKTQIGSIVHYKEWTHLQQ
jgi:hypothetical protein